MDLLLATLTEWRQKEIATVTSTPPISKSYPFLFLNMSHKYPFLLPWPFSGFSWPSLPPFWASYLHAIALSLLESRSSSPAPGLSTFQHVLPKRVRVVFYNSNMIISPATYNSLRDSQWSWYWKMSLTRPAKAWLFCLFYEPYFALLPLPFPVLKAHFLCFGFSVALHVIWRRPLHMLSPPHNLPRLGTCLSCFSFCLLLITLHCSPQASFSYGNFLWPTSLGKIPLVSALTELYCFASYSLVQFCNYIPLIWNYSITVWLISSMNKDYISLLGVPENQWLKQQKCTVSLFWRLEVWNQGVGRVGSFWGLWGKNLFQALLLGL